MKRFCSLFLMALALAVSAPAALAHGPTTATANDGFQLTVSADLGSPSNGAVFVGFVVYVPHNSSTDHFVRAEGTGLTFIAVTWDMYLESDDSQVAQDASGGEVQTNAMGVWERISNLSVSVPRTVGSHTALAGAILVRNSNVGTAHSHSYTIQRP